ncbi:MAG TPA: hypothetical protein DHN33_00400 [Eubacteriaceae bacterium]|nr:hypothetical protein [Eubacteriaceae bacterium]
MNQYEGLKKVKITAIALTLLLGLAFHELYKASEIPLLGVIAPVNESKWEHWKMTYTPMLIIGSMEYVYLKKQKKMKRGNYWFALAGGILVFEVVTFGLIEGVEVVFGYSALWVHVSTFLFGGIVGSLAKYLLLEKIRYSKLLQLLGIMVLVGQFVLFAAFTFDPPRVEYFRDSKTHTYGIYEIQ